MTSYLPEAEGSCRVALWLASGLRQDTTHWQGVVVDVTFNCGYLQHHRALSRLHREGKIMVIRLEPSRESKFTLSRTEPSCKGKRMQLYTER